MVKNRIIIGSKSALCRKRKFATSCEATGRHRSGAPVQPFDRALCIYKSKRGDQADLTHRIKSICETQVRYGYRRASMSVSAEWLGFQCQTRPPVTGNRSAITQQNAQAPGRGRASGAYNYRSSRASLPRWRHGLPSAARCTRTGLQGKGNSRRRSVAIKAPSRAARF